MCNLDHSVKLSNKFCRSRVSAVHGSAHADYIATLELPCSAIQNGSTTGCSVESYFYLFLCVPCSMHLSLFLTSAAQRALSAAILQGGWAGAFRSAGVRFFFPMVTCARTSVWGHVGCSRGAEVEITGSRTGVGSPRELTGTVALKGGIPPGPGRYTNTGHVACAFPRHYHHRRTFSDGEKFYEKTEKTRRLTRRGSSPKLVLRSRLRGIWSAYWLHLGEG